MVFIRLTVKIFPRQQVHATSVTAKKPGIFLLPIEDPERVTLGGLVGLIQEKWRYLHPDLEPLAIKTILDDKKVDAELYPELTVADVWVNHGKARADGLDQEGSVRVIQKPAEAAPERFPSVVQDWDAAAIAFQRRRESKQKREVGARRISPIHEEDEDDTPSKDIWSLPHKPSPPKDSQSKPLPANNVEHYQRNYPLSSVEYDHDDLARLANTEISIAGTPPPRGGSEELGETPPSSLPPWTYPQTQPQTADPEGLPLSKRRAATPGTRIISLLPYERKSSNSESSPAVLLPHPSLSQPQPFDLGDSTEDDSDSDSDKSNYNAENTLEPKADENQPSQRQASAGGNLDISQPQEPHPAKSTENEDKGQDKPNADGDVSMTDASNGSRPSTNTAASRKRKFSIDEPSPTREARVKPASQSVRQDSGSKSPEAENPNVLASPSHSSKPPTLADRNDSIPMKRKQSPENSVSNKEARVKQTHPSTRPMSASPDGDVQIVKVSPCEPKSPASPAVHSPVRSQRIPPPPSFCSPQRRANWAKEMQRRSPGQHMERGLGLGITRMPAGNPTSQKESQARADDLSKHVSPSSLTAKHNQITPSRSSIDAVYPSETSNYDLKATQESQKSEIQKRLEEAAIRKLENQEQARLNEKLNRGSLPANVESIVNLMLRKLKRMPKVKIVDRRGLRAELDEMREKLRSAESKEEASKPTPAKPTPPKPVSGKTATEQGTSTRAASAKPNSKSPAPSTTSRAASIMTTSAGSASPQPASQGGSSLLKKLLLDQKEELAAKARTPAPTAAEAGPSSRSRSVRASVSSGSENDSDGSDSDSESDSESESDSDSGDIMPDGRSRKLLPARH